MHSKQLSIHLIVTLLFFVVGCGGQQVVDKSTEEKKADLYYSTGTANLMNGSYTEALDKLIEANQLRPNDTKILNNLGMAYYFKNDVKKALLHIKKAIEVDPKNSDARVNLASIYFKQKSYGEAKNQYLHVTKDLLYKSQYRTYYNLGLLSLRENHLDHAKNYFLKSVNEREDYCPANYQLAQIERKKYNFASALNWFRKAQLGLCVNQPEAHLGEALTLIELREFEQATVKLNFIIEKFSSTPIATAAMNELKAIETKTDSSKNGLSLQERLRLERKLNAIRNEDPKSFESPSF